MEKEGWPAHSTFRGLLGDYLLPARFAAQYTSQGDVNFALILTFRFGMAFSAAQPFAALQTSPSASKLYN